MLVEMLVFIITVPLVMVAISGFFRSFIRDIPQATRLVQQNTTVLNMLDQLRRDTDRAVGLPDQVGDRRVDDITLLIGQADAVVCYRFEEGQVVRTLLNGKGESTPDENRVWRARDAVVEWRPWVQDGKVCGVEVHSHLKLRVADEMRRKFAGSHVFFIRGLAEGGETR